MKIYDVTMTISKDMAVYKNKQEKKPVFSVASSKKNGDSTNETSVMFNVHTGTHLDFPRHIDSDGLTSRHFDITSLLRKVVVVDLTNVRDVIKVSDLQTLALHENDFVFFKTRNSYSENFEYDFVYVSVEAATYLAKHKISGVGTDALGIEREQAGHPTHRVLMEHNIAIIEGLRLKEVPEGDYHMIALPLKLDDVDALPLTVLLMEV